MTVSELDRALALAASSDDHATADDEHGSDVTWTFARV